MKSFELESTYENIRDTYLADKIGRNAEVKQFVRFLDSISGSFSVALNSPWGSGKTFFVKQVKMILEAFNDFSESNMNVYDKARIKETLDYPLKNLFVPIYYDAWVNDNDNDPILSLVYEISKSIINCNFSEDYTDALEIAGSLADTISGRNIKSLIESLLPTDSTKEIKKQRDLETSIKEFLNDILPERGDKLLIIIDELDRCKPTFAIKLLERIKHYFNNENIIFVFSVNCSELQHTVKNYYGEGFNGAQYLDRFFNITIPLSKCNVYQYCESLGYNAYNLYNYQEMAVSFINSNSFEMRQISKFFGIISLLEDKFFKITNGIDSTLRNAYKPIVVTLIGLILKNSTEYFDFISGKNSSSLIDMVKNCDCSGYCLDSLLKDNETFDPNDGSSKQYVDISNKTIELYNTLFVNTFSEDCYYKKVGKMQIHRNDADKLIKIANLLNGKTSL